MQRLISEYEKSDKKLRKRIAEINKQLKLPNLKAMEKQCLTARRILLYKESYEIREAIAEMKSIQKGVS